MLCTLRIEHSWFQGIKYLEKCALLNRQYENLEGQKQTTNTVWIMSSIHQIKINIFGFGELLLVRPFKLNSFAYKPNQWNSIKYNHFISETVALHIFRSLEPDVCYHTHTHTQHWQASILRMWWIEFGFHISRLLTHFGSMHIWFWHTSYRMCFPIFLRLYCQVD